ncbi:MAG: PadR family transcriptional regulator [Clostridia bacterium]
MNPQFKKGFLEMFILKTIQNDEPIYGYDIMKKISEIFDDVDKATVYAVLRRLHNAKILDVEFLKSTEGPPRKYYKLTEEGQKTLAENIEHLKKIIEISQKLGIEY